MFLIRAAFWLSVAILLIPTDPQTGEAPRVTVVNALLAARVTISDLSAFCDRNPDVCVTGGAAIDIFADKAENGARMLYRYLNEADPADGEEVRGTLSEDDVALPWRGRGKDAGAA